MSSGSIPWRCADRRTSTQDEYYETVSFTRPIGTVALSATLSSHCWIRVQIQAGRGFQDEATRSSPIPPAVRLGCCWVRFLPEVILLAVRWYLRYGLSCRDLRLTACN